MIGGQSSRDKTREGERTTVRPLLIMIGGLVAISGCRPGETVPVPGDQPPAAQPFTTTDATTPPFVPAPPLVVPAPPLGYRVVDGGGIGCFRVGDPVSSIGTATPVISDTVVQGMEGMMERQLRATIGGDTLMVTVSNETIRRLVVTNPRFRTTDSLGVGTELDRLLAVPGATALEGEGRLFVTVPTHCGLSFRLAAIREGRGGTTDELVRAVLQRNTPVDQVLIIGCRP